MSDIIDFFKGEKQIVFHVEDKEFSMFHHEVIYASLFFREYCHNYIQWVFPLKEKSQFNPNAPILSEKDISIIKNLYKDRIEAMFVRMLEFYGFTYKCEFENTINTKLVESILKNDNFEQYAINWLNKGNHNFLRITRILKCLNLFGLENLAKLFYDQLAFIYNENKNIISKRTFDFWTEAAINGK